MARAACMVPLDAVAQQRAASSTDVVWWVINRNFYMWIPRWREELYSEGTLALCIAARNFDPAKARWSTYAVSAVWGALMEHLRRRLHRWKAENVGPLDYYGAAPDGCLHEPRPLRDVGALRIVPQSRGWSCAECHREIDWDRNRAGRFKGDVGRGLCATCAFARARAKRRWGGEGVCARCARIVRSKHGKIIGTRNGRRVFGPSTPKCACSPDYPPSLTLAAASAKPAWELGSDR